MRLPRTEADRMPEWVSKPGNDTLVYFAQLMHELLAHQTRDSHRVASLDSYHRLREVERTWEEARIAGFDLKLEPLFDELRSYLARDPVIKSSPDDWNAVLPRLKSADSRPAEAVEAVRFLANRLEGSYLKKCRDYIALKVRNGASKDRRDLRFAIENYCAYLLSLGFPAQSIYYRVLSEFYDRNIEDSPIKVISRFFSYFPNNKASAFSVVVGVSADFGGVLAKRSEFTKLPRDFGVALKTVAMPFSVARTNVYQWQTDALDVVDARLKCEMHLSSLRAIAYTAAPSADLHWDPHVVVNDGQRSVVLKEGVEALRMGRRKTLKGLNTSMDSRLDFFLDRPRSLDDQNRIRNAFAIYASAFHSENPASRLLSLWSSLEGLLPAPDGTGSRISSFARDVENCHMRLHFIRKMESLQHDFTGLYKESYSAILNKVKAKRTDSVTRLASLICLEENKVLLTEMGALCASNPLGRQRLFELYSDCSNVGRLYDQTLTASDKVRWQLNRIYRERNRIVHRASPSPNVAFLILTLNAYILMVMDAILGVGTRSGAGTTIDDIFSEIRIGEEARALRINELRKDKLTPDSLDLLIGEGRP